MKRMLHYKLVDTSAIAKILCCWPPNMLYNNNDDDNHNVMTTFFWIPQIDDDVTWELSPRTG